MPQVAIGSNPLVYIQEKNILIKPASGAHHGAHHVHTIHHARDGVWCDGVRQPRYSLPVRQLSPPRPSHSPRCIATCLIILERLGFSFRSGICITFRGPTFNMFPHLSVGSFLLWFCLRVRELGSPLCTVQNVHHVLSLSEEMWGDIRSGM